MTNKKFANIYRKLKTFMNIKRNILQNDTIKASGWKFNYEN